MKIERNISLFYAYRFFWIGLFFASILFLFYEQKNLSFYEITTLGIVWSVFAFLFEVPTGILSDRWSRKYTLILSSLFSILTFIVFLYSENYLLFTIAILFYALRDTMFSGTSTAILYDSLKEMGREKEYEKILGRSNFFHAISLVTASILGSYLFTIDAGLPFILSCIFAGLSLLVALFFIEPTPVTETEETKIFAHIKASVKYLVTNKLVRFFVFYLIFLRISLELVVEHDQFYLIAGAVPTIFFGLWFATKELAGGIVGIAIEKLRAITGKHADVVGLSGIAISILLVAILPTYIGLLMIISLIVFSSFLNLLVNANFNHLVSSDMRATTGSLIVFFATIIDIPLRFFFGLVGDVHGVRGAYLYVFCITAVAVLYFILFKPKSVQGTEPLTTN